MAKFEGYYDDAKEEFKALKAKLKHDVSRDLDRAKKELLHVIEQEILSEYYFQSDATKALLQYDPQMAEAERIIKDEKEYHKLLSPKK